MTDAEVLIIIVGWIVCGGIIVALIRLFINLFRGK